MTPIRVLNPRLRVELSTLLLLSFVPILRLSVKMSNHDDNNLVVPNLVDDAVWEPARKAPMRMCAYRLPCVRMLAYSRQGGPNFIAEIPAKSRLL